MVSLGHDHGDGEDCPGCRFREALAELLESAADGPEDEWHDATAEIIFLMNGALSALTALRSGRFDHDLHDEEHASMAAAAISRLGGRIEELYEAIMDDADEGQADF